VAGSTKSYRLSPPYRAIGNKYGGILSDLEGKKNGKNGKKTAGIIAKRKYLLIVLTKRNFMRTPVFIINIFIIITLTISILEILNSKEKKQVIKSLLYYLITSLILFSFLDFKNLNFILPNQSLAKRIIFESYTCIFCFFELNFFIVFFQKHQPLKKGNRVLKKIPFLFLSLVLIFILFSLTIQPSEKTIITISVLLNIFEYLILFSTCLIFFYSIVKNNIKEAPICKHVLIIISSLFIYISVSLPFLIIADKIKLTHRDLQVAFYFIHYLVILIVFLTISYTIKTKKHLYYA